MNVLPMATLAAGLLPLTASAQTPDEIVPAVEDVCEAFRGAAKGLCNAYCEAMDCNDPRVRAAEPACETTAQKFLRITHLPEMPCDDVPPPPVCSIDAIDDELTMNDPQSFTLPLFANDVVSPPETPITLAAVSPAEGITVDPTTGVVTGTWVADDAVYSRAFTYTACCAEDTCDTATVTIYGS